MWNIEESEHKLLRAEGYDEHGYPRGLVEAGHPHIRQEFIPLLVVAPTLAVRHREPPLPLAADGTGHPVEFEALHRRDLDLVVFAVTPRQLRPAMIDGSTLAQVSSRTRSQNRRRTSIAASSVLALMSSWSAIAA